MATPLNTPTHDEWITAALRPVPLSPYQRDMIAPQFRILLARIDHLQAVLAQHGIPVSKP